MDDRIGCQLIGNAYPFRNRCEGRSNLGEYAGGAQEATSFLTPSSVTWVPGLLCTRGKFCFDLFRDTGEINGCNGFPHLRLNGFIVCLGQVEGCIPTATVC